MNNIRTNIAIIGAGIAGLSTAFYLAKRHNMNDVLLVDSRQPMSFTSAESGENYRNWWMRPEMVALTNRSIDLMEDIANDSADRINMTRSGYSLATRATNIDDLISQICAGLGESAAQLLRFHDSAEAPTYGPPADADWRAAPQGVDVLRHRDTIHRVFTSYCDEIRTVIHVRRAGTIDSHQLGMHMLEHLRDNKSEQLVGYVESIERHNKFILQIRTPDGVKQVVAERIVNAAGPFAGDIASMLGTELPILNNVQQKIAFDDRAAAIPRDMPFSVDLDAQKINWSDEERELLQEHAEFGWLVEEMPGAVHCRPDGGGSWVKLGWAYNDTPASPTWEPTLDPYFPDIVLRGASRLHPSLKRYIGRLPRSARHYGGWYTMTRENWPLIGPMGPEGAYMNCALSGFGTMAACAAGELCAAWVAGAELPSYAHGFSLMRYHDEALMASLLTASKGRL